MQIHLDIYRLVMKPCRMRCSRLIFGLDNSSRRGEQDVERNVSIGMPE